MTTKIKNIPIQERPREKALRNGVENLSNSELLAIIIKNGIVGSSALDIAQKLIYKFESFSNVFQSNIECLVKVKGIKKVKALEIIAIGEILKRIANEKIHEKFNVNHPEDIIKYFQQTLGNKEREEFLVIYLNVKNQIIKYETLFTGGINYSLIDINLIFKKAIQLSASKLICLHNHPSGDVKPSLEDIEITKKIHERGLILDIYLLDHIIVSKNNFLSLKQEKLF